MSAPSRNDLLPAAPVTANAQGDAQLAVQGSFSHHWQAAILKQRPLILPRRHYVYPREAEEVERGALELSITPQGSEVFLATCALGFADPLAPTGVWSCPNPHQVCAVAGGYAYLIDTLNPERFEHVAYRPVLSIYQALEAGLLLFVGSRNILAYDANGRAWESPRLSDEGLTVRSVEGRSVSGTGWLLTSDSEAPFTLALTDGSSTSSL